MENDEPDILKWHRAAWHRVRVLFKLLFHLTVCLSRKDEKHVFTKAQDQEKNKRENGCNLFFVKKTK